ncbi:MAG: hypothetical protein H0U74_12835 [Bradymonadaceae bacterium]|nr:hypothetical protein [Lujinxingiaceae bacterium]
MSRKHFNVESAAVCLLLCVGLVACSSPSEPNDGVRDVGQDAVGDASADGAGLDTQDGAQADLQDDADHTSEPAMALFDPASEDFFALPFPADARRRQGGSLGFVDWPGVMQNPVLRLWFPAADELLEGFSLIGGMFVWFDAPLDATSVPSSFERSLPSDDEWPSVYLIDVGESSVERGKLYPIECKFTAKRGTFHAPNQLACIAPFGMVRRPSTQYAFVVTTAVRGADGLPVQASGPTLELLAGRDVAGAHGPIAGAPYAQALTIIEQAGGSPEDIAMIALYTTVDPAARLRTVNAWYDKLPEPVIDTERALSVHEVYDDYIVLEGFYDVPVIQTGQRPYGSSPSGKIVWKDGEPEQVDKQSIRFFLTVPRQPMPAAGFATMLYLHGSGGRAEELLDRGARLEADTEAPLGSGPAMSIAQYGIAGFAADFNLHGMRHDPPDTSGLMLYNLVGNPRAAIDNFIIGANEVTLHARLLAGLTIDPALAPQYLDAGEANDGLIRFDTDRFALMGQSMGSTIGLPAITVSDLIDAGVFSGSGGVLIEVALKSQRPINVGAVLRQVLRYRADEDFDRFDPMLSSVQQLWDLVDPVAHGRHVFQEPHPGRRPRHVLQHSGLDDGYFSPGSRAAFSLGLGVPLVAPVLEAEAFDQMQWRGLGEPVQTPVHQNAPGAVTAVAVQYAPSVLDGHNVGFQLDDAKAQYACFIRGLGPLSAPTLYSAQDASVANCP